MPLTKPALYQFRTDEAVLKDPITVLHGGATIANVDVGFLMNRANGLLPNVAVYWSEANSSFVMAFTANTGSTNSNILPSSYTTLTTGNLLPGANATYSLGSPTQRFSGLYVTGNTIDLGGATIKTDPVTGAVAVVPLPTVLNPDPVAIIITAGGSITTANTVGGVLNLSNVAAASNIAAATGSSFTNIVTSGDANIGGNLTVAGTVTFTNTVVETSTELVLGVEIVGGNLVANSNNSSTNTTTGALVVQGGAGISGNLNVGGNFYANNAFVDRGLDMNDWNTVTTMGVYLVNRSSWTGTSNTPLNSLNFYGVLEVYNSGNTAITQNYRPYDNSTGPNIFWTRSKYGASSWTNWAEMLNGAESLDGGSF